MHTSAPPAPDARWHHIDALRVFAFGLLIPYHLAMVYVAGWDFHIKSAYQWEWLQWPMIAVNRWRMPLLFTISGIALGLAWRHQGYGRLAGARSWRLLLPLAFGMLAIVPVQAWCEARAGGAFDGGFGDFMLRYLQLRPWPDGGFSGAEHGVTWNHLWYLAYAWLYSMLLLALGPLLDSARAQRWRGALARSHAGWWIVLPVAWQFASFWWLLPAFPETHALLGDWHAHAKYAMYMLAGWFIAREPGAMERQRGWRHGLLALALAALLVELSLRAAGRHLPPGDIPAWALAVDWAMVERMARAVYAWTAVLAILAWARTLLQRPFAWLPQAREAVYPWYLLHQSLIVLAAFWLVPLDIGPLAEPALVLAATVAGCLLVHRLVVRHSGPLRPLWGLPAKPWGRHAAERLAHGARPRACPVPPRVGQ